MFSEILLVSEIFRQGTREDFYCTFWNLDKQILPNTNTMNQEQRSKKCIFSGIATALVNTLRFRGVLPVLSIGLSPSSTF